MTDPGEESADQTAAQAARPAARRGLWARLRVAVLGPGAGDRIGDWQKTSNQLAQQRTDLAIARNLMAADRTLMAWVRTSLSLYSFGFTIYKILEGFEETGNALPSSDTPREIGLFLTGLGTLAMVMGTIEYWNTLKQLRQFETFALARAALIMALVMSVVGVFLFFSITIKLF